MTVRAIIIGLLAAVLMGAGGQYASKYVPGMWGLVRGHLPVSVYGAVIFFVIVLNPLLGKIRDSWRSRVWQIVLVLAMALAGHGAVYALGRMPDASDWSRGLLPAGLFGGFALAVVAGGWLLGRARESWRIGRPGSILVVAVALIACAVTYASCFGAGAGGVARGFLSMGAYAMLLMLILLNPLAGKIRESWRFKPAEIALIFGLALVGCGIAEAGMMRYFPRQLVTPLQQEQTHPGWQRSGVLQYTPPMLLANDGKYDYDVVNDFITAMGVPGKSVVPIQAVPWHAWWKPLVVWSTLIALTLLGSICLAVLVHRQWADKERIRYPLAEMASSLLKQDDAGRTTIFHNKLFWVGVGIPLFVRLVNGLYTWFPKSIQIQMSFDFSALKVKFPEFMKTPYADSFASPTLFPAVIGLTFLLASDIGLSLGLANVLTVGLLFALISFGLDLSGGDMLGSYTGWQSFGSFLAMGCMLLYIGRRYYWQTSKEALSFVPQAETEPAGVWSLRLFLICLAGALAILIAVGMDWVLAVLSVLIIMLTVVVCTRMNTECGTFFLSPPWKVAGVLGGLFGMAALGPKMIIILGMIMYLVQADVFECLMPFVSNGLKIGSDASLKVGRTGAVFAIGLLLAIGVAVPTALWADYNHAAALRRGDDGATIWNTAERSITQLSMAGQLETVNQFGAWDRLMNMKPEKTFLVAAAVGFFLFLLFSALRLRYTWWPLHPIIILVFGTQVGRFGFSFMLGWLIKVMLSKFGGAQKYTQFKPMMIGVVVGDLSGGFIMMMAGWIYYAVKGIQGPYCAPLW